MQELQKYLNGDHTLHKNKDEKLHCTCNFFQVLIKTEIKDAPKTLEMLFLKKYDLENIYLQNLFLVEGG